MIKVFTENPVAEKGDCILLWKMALELRTDTSLMLGCDGCARHRAKGVLAPGKAGPARGRANQGGTTAYTVVLDGRSRAAFFLAF